MKKFLAILMVMAIMLSMMTVVASAGDVEVIAQPNYIIDHTRTGSITLHKYDLIEANKDPAIVAALQGYISTGVADADLETLMAPYAIRGVEFKYLKVANIVQYSYLEVDDNDTPADESDDTQVHKTILLYEINDVSGADLLTALGLSTANAYDTSNAAGFTPAAGCHYYEADVLIAALRTALAANATTVKNALEAYMTAQNAAAMPLTGDDGVTTVSNLPLGLYLMLESRVPESVASTTNPFFVSVPMTSVSGVDGSAISGGDEWMYNIVLYPKNETYDPTMEKVVREAKADTGTHSGSLAYDAGYGNVASASGGDVVEYVIRGRLPRITSDATALSYLDWVDVLGPGLEYNGSEVANAAGLLKDHFNANDVVISFYTDEHWGEFDKVAEWKENDESAKFAVTYGTGANDASTMTVSINTAGLQIINKNGRFDGRPADEQGFSQLYYKISYTATVNQNTDLLLGEDGNHNDVTMTWKRTNPAVIGTVVDNDTTVYSAGIDLTKLFSDGATGKFRDVKFRLKNVTDNYWVTAIEPADPANSGVWYVNGHVAAEANGTLMSPGAADGKLMIHGLEPDEYRLYEVETADGYQLLDTYVTFTVTAVERHDTENHAANEDGYTYAELSAQVDGEAVDMEPDGESDNAYVPATIVNPKNIIDLPPTGGDGTLTLVLFGVGLLTCAGFVIYVIKKRKEQNEN